MSSRLSIIARATASLGVLVAAVGGVTYAQLTSNTATLSDNTVSSNTAELSIKNQSTGAFGATAPGYTVTDFIPGKPVEGPVTVKNTGGVPLNVTAKVPVLPTVSGFSGWENATFTFSAICDDGKPAHATFTSLNNPGVAMPCGPLAAAGERTYNVRFNIDPNSVSGNKVEIQKFDLAFSGEAAI